MSGRNHRDFHKVRGAASFAAEGAEEVVTVDAEGSDINDLIQFVLALDRAVVDETRLIGLYTFHIEFALDQTTTPALAPPGAPPADTSDPSGAPSVFTAVQEQLGLRLEPAKEPRDVVVIDHIEKPSEN